MWRALKLTGACMLLLLHSRPTSATPEAPIESIHHRHHLSINGDIGPNLIDQMLQSSESLEWDVAWSDLGVSTSKKSPVDASSPSDAVMQCINRHHNKQNMTTEMAFSNEIGSVRVAGAWWSKDVLESPSPVTVVTSGSMDRLTQLEAQCHAWGGPSSMVLFQGVIQEKSWPLTKENQDILKNLVVEVAEFMTRLTTKNGSCKPQVLLTYEVYTEPAAFHLYPVNLLRNVARLQATTPLVALLDADLLPSKSMFDRFRNYSIAEDFMKELEETNKVYIIPAFDLTLPYLTATWAEAVVSAPDKAIMSWGLDNNMVAQFHGKRWAAGHRLTNFTKWKTAEEDYVVSYEKSCEPWIVGSRTKMPWYDERYRGFGFNKIQHLMNIHTDNFIFAVLHDSYLVHRPHKHAEAQKMFMDGRKNKNHRPEKLAAATPGVDSKTGSNKNTNLYKHVASLFAEQLAAKKKSVRWSPIVGGTTEGCLHDLKFWSETKTRQQ